MKSCRRQKKEANQVTCATSRRGRLK
jgi:hypothetical protein